LRTTQMINIRPARCC